MVGGQLLSGTLIIVTTVVFHVAGLVGLANPLRRQAASAKFSPNRGGMMYLLGSRCLASVIIGIHTVEAWGWA